MLVNSVNILLVEDDEVDAEAIRRALRKSKLANPLQVVGNGLEALEALRGENGHEALPRPNLILLDLNMPRMNGLEFLAELRKDEALRDTIVFVLTTSDADRDRVEAYERNVAGYILKSKVGEDFMSLIDLLDVYWRIVEFPTKRIGGA